MAFTQIDGPQRLAEATGLKETALRRLAETPESVRQKLPPKAGWSAAGIVEHLILSEECVAGPWRESLARNASAKLSVKSGLVARMESAAMSRTNMRVPTLPELIPKGGLTLPELEQRWQQTRTRLVAALPEDPNAAWIIHPAFGPFSASHMGIILAAHLKHHLRHWPMVN